MMIERTSLACPIWQRLLLPLAIILCILEPAQPALEGTMQCTVIFAESDQSARPCRCNHNTNTVDCQARNLTVLPREFPARMKRLNLENNMITTVSREQLGSIDSLLHLDLSNNIIRNIGDNAFGGLINLKILELGNNDLKTVQNGTFSGLYNLHQLNLESNKISTIHPQALTSLKNLRQLNLQGNRVSTLQCALVQNLTLLQLLSLRANPIKLIEDQCFYGLINLQDIQLKRCSLTKIENSTFKYLVQLSTLNLAWNKISQISPLAFRESGQLTRLHLNNNNISNLPIGVFANLTKLQKLHLHHNPITSLSTDLFTDLQSLEFLLLHNLKLSSLQKETFVSLPPLQYLDLSSNYLQNLPKGFGQIFNSYWNVKLSANLWRCDCEIRSIYEFSFIANEIVCQSPINFQGMSLNQIPYSNLSCTSPRIAGMLPYTFAVINDTVFLQCNSSGFPTPSLSWLLPQGTMISSLPGTGLQSEGENGLMLVIESAQPSDTGMYICNASNPGGKDFLLTYLKVFDPACVVSVSKENVTFGNESDTVFDFQANCSSTDLSDNLSGVTALGYSEFASITETKLCPSGVPCTNAAWKRPCETDSKSQLNQPQMVTATAVNCNYLVTWFVIGIVAGVSLIIACWIGFTMIYRKKIRERIVLQQAIEKWKRKNNQKDMHLKPAISNHGQHPKRRKHAGRNRMPTPSSSDVGLSQNGEKNKPTRVAFAEEGNPISQSKKLSSRSSLLETDNRRPVRSSEALNEKSRASNEKSRVENDQTSSKVAVSTPNEGSAKLEPINRTSSRTVNSRKPACAGPGTEGKNMPNVSNEVRRGTGPIASPPPAVPNSNRPVSGQSNTTCTTASRPNLAGRPTSTSYTSPSSFLERIYSGYLGK